MNHLSKSFNGMSAREKRELLTSLLQEKRVVSRTFPLSFAQQRLWFLDQLEPGNSIYNISCALQINGRLNIGALERGLKEVMGRHESLRTTFIAHNGQPVQVVSEQGNLSFPFLDLRGMPESRCMSEARYLVDKEVRRPFDLAIGPLLRATLIGLDKEIYILLLSMHHIISDAWSQHILIREVVTLYDTFAQGKSSPLVALPLQYADFAVWQRNWLQGDILQGHFDYWKKQLRGAVPLNLPTDRPRPPVSSYKGAVSSFMLPPALAQALVVVGRQHEATLFMTLLAAFQVLLYRSTGQTDVVVGTDIANRTAMETEGLIGFFVNLLVLRTDLSGGPTFRNLLRHVRKMMLEVYTYQHLPFEMLVESLKVERHANQIPLIRVLFVLQNIPRAPRKIGHTLFEPIANGVTMSRFDLALFMREQSGNIGGEVIYSTELFDEQTIVNIIKRFEVLLQSIVAGIDVPLDSLDIYTDADKVEQAKEKLARRKVALHQLKMTRNKGIDLIE